MDEGQLRSSSVGPKVLVVSALGNHKDITTWLLGSFNPFDIPNAWN